VKICSGIVRMCFSEAHDFFKPPAVLEGRKSSHVRVY
jgi:hypothetical protein